MFLRVSGMMNEWMNITLNLHYNISVSCIPWSLLVFLHLEERAKLKKLQVQEKKKNAEFRAKVGFYFLRIDLIQQAFKNFE